MTKQETLQSFFEAWIALESLPKKPGRHGLEHQAAIDLLRMRANAVKKWVPDSEITPTPSADAQAFHALRGQIASIPPKDTRVKGG